MHWKKRFQFSEHQLNLGRGQNLETEQGVGVGLLDELDVFNEIFFPAAQLVDGLLQLDVLLLESLAAGRELGGPIAGGADFVGSRSRGSGRKSIEMKCHSKK